MVRAYPFHVLLSQCMPHFGITSVLCSIDPLLNASPLATVFQRGIFQVRSSQWLASCLFAHKESLACRSW